MPWNGAAPVVMYDSNTKFVGILFQQKGGREIRSHGNSWSFSFPPSPLQKQVLPLAETGPNRTPSNFVFYYHGNLRFSPMLFNTSMLGSINLLLLLLDINNWPESSTTKEPVDNAACMLVCMRYAVYGSYLHFSRKKYGQLLLFYWCFAMFSLQMAL